MTGDHDPLPWLDRIEYLERAVKSRLAESRHHRGERSFASDIEELWGTVCSAIGIIPLADGNFNDPAPETQRARLLWWYKERPSLIERLLAVLGAYKLLIRTHLLSDVEIDPPLPTRPKLRRVAIHVEDVESQERELVHYAQQNQPVPIDSFRREILHLMGWDNPVEMKRREREAKALAARLEEYRKSLKPKDGAAPRRGARGGP
jgi:hypothetical protein